MILNKAKFIKNNEGFICINCGKLVSKHPSTSRDHCNYCLYGKHVDIYPGDRLNKCKGILEPIGIKVNNKKTQIEYKCTKCKETIFNIASADDNRDNLYYLNVSAIPI